MPAPAPTTSAPVICPECGTPTTAHARKIASRRGAYSKIPWIVTFLAILSIGIAAWVTRGSFRAAGSFPLEQEVAEVAHMSVENLKRIAAGGGDGSLRASARGGVNLWRSWIKPDTTPVLRVRMQSKAGSVFSSRSFGWPSPWASISDERSYSDLDARSGPIPPPRRKTGSRSWYNGLRFESETTDPTSVLYRRIEFNGTAVAYSIVLALAVFWFGRRVLAPLLRRARDADTAQLSARRIGRVCVLAFALFMLAAAILQLQPMPATPRRDRSLDAPQSGLSMTWTEDEIQAFPPGPATDAEIAKRALALIDSNGAQGDDIAIFYSAPISQGYFESLHLGPERAAWISYQRGGPLQPFPKDAAWRASCSVRGLSVSWNRDDQAVLSVNFVALAPFVLAVFLLHFLIKRLTYAALLRSTLNRARNNLCQHCAYPLPVARLPTTPSP